MIKQYRQGCMYKSYKYKHKIKMGIWSNQYHSYLEIKNNQIQKLLLEMNLKCLNLLNIIY